MKKRIIAMSVAAAVGGFAGSANAQFYYGPADHFAFSERGIGHILYVPYFSTQEGNITALNIVNTDTWYGKVLKVRFRGASNSDDVYDFQVFMSPGDVWTAGIVQGSDGKSRLFTEDKSCTLPANVNGSFITTRLPSAGGAAETREGYVEILTMADIVDDDYRNWQDLFDTTKHDSSGVPECDSAVLSDLTHENAWEYMTEPTTGIMANWTIINVNKVVAYSGAAAAIEARTSDGLPGWGNLVYWDQRSIPLTSDQANANTADPLLRGATPIVAGARYDLPDLSTPYLPAAFNPTCPFCQAKLLSDSMALWQIAGEFVSEPDIGAQTDWVVSFPTRRYWAAVQYTGTGAPKAVYNNVSDNVYFTSATMELGNSSNGGKSYQLCSKLGTEAVAFWNREEIPTVSDDIVISPGTPTQLSICGEVAIVGINAGAGADTATFGSVARQNVTNGFTEGWGTLTASQNGAFGMPMLAIQFTRYTNLTDSMFYGTSYPARSVILGSQNPNYFDPF